MLSGMDLPRGKVAPGVYPAAAAALSVDPARTAVVEDPVSVDGGVGAELPSRIGDLIRYRRVAFTGLACRAK
jgi:hypothetical protein